MPCINDRAAATGVTGITGGFNAIGIIGAIDLPASQADLMCTISLAEPKLQASLANLVLPTLHAEQVRLLSFANRSPSVTDTTGGAGASYVIGGTGAPCSTCRSGVAPYLSREIIETLLLSLILTVSHFRMPALNIKSCDSEYFTTCFKA